MSGAAPIESPCVSVCRMVPGAEVCAGCFRSAGEIAAWLGYTPAERRAVMADLPRRRAEFIRRNQSGGSTDVV